MSDEADFPMTGEGDIKISDSFIRSLQECEELCRSLCISESCSQMMKTKEDGVRSTAGGFVLAVGDETTIRRFIILGTSSGTYYSREKQLTMDNVNALINIIERGRGSLILKEIHEVSRAGRNPKQDPLLFALALCARYNVCDTIRKLSRNKEALERGHVAAAKLKYLRELHKSAFEIVNDVCRIPAHLFTFVKYCEMVSQSTQLESGKKSTGWGRLMRGAIQRWYASKSPGQLAMHLTKYPQRDGWSHRDLFRLAHPKLKVSIFSPTILEYKQLYHFAVKDVEQPTKKYRAVQMDTELNSRALDLVEAVMALKNEKDEAKVVAAIKKHRLVREQIPADMLSSVAVWQALLDGMPMTAMIRNLGKMQSIGVLTDSFRASVIARLTSEEELKRAKIHPVHVLMAKTAYESGHGGIGELSWKANEEINGALEVAFYKSFINAPPTNKRYCFAFGRLWKSISGAVLSCQCASASVALSLVSMKNEKIYGATDCALPMLWAKENNKKFDVFVVYKDNEISFRDVHPYQALRDYRESSGIVDAKLVVMGMTAADFTIADPEDAGMLDIVGFDSAVPALLNEFVTGKI
uniref:TROVE domain-containing protein n=1 Tax=Angiostrongylus cantonensis TaxID=6313 RepID=A0A0K0DL98_ANGCA